MLLEDVLKEFLFHLETRNYSVRTTKGYRNNIKAFLKYATIEYEIKELDDIKSIHIKGYFLYLKSKGRKETYINGIFKGIRSFFNYCVEEEYLLSSKNPCLNVRWMKEAKVIIKTFNDDEVQKMVNSFKMTDYYQARNKLIMMVLVDTGIRNLELCTLTMENILETTMIIEGKGNKQRYLYLSPTAQDGFIKNIPLSGRWTLLNFTTKLRKGNLKVVESEYLKNEKSLSIEALLFCILERMIDRGSIQQKRFMN